MKNPLNKSLLEIHRFFTKEKIPYVFIGGIALQFWGEPRFTKDIDITILVNPEDEKRVIEKIFSQFLPRISDANDFAKKHRICLVRNKLGIDIDISLGIPGYEEEVMKRAVKFKLGNRNYIKICSAEDLIIHKLIAGRPQDLYDVEGIIIRQERTLDKNYILRWLKEFSKVLENKEIIKRFNKIWSEVIRNENSIKQRKS